MESLNKQQLILAALLISFVTSIATGIVTVSLMDQETQGVTQTINRVVEKTIERVVQAPVPQGATAVITKETVVVNADDATVAAIEKNSRSVLRLFTEEVSPETGEMVPVYVGLGFFIGKDGSIVADKTGLVSGGAYSATLSNGTVFPVVVEYIPESGGAAILKIIRPEKGTVDITPVLLGDSNLLKLGQSVISIGGKDRNEVAQGLVSSLMREKNELATSTPKTEQPLIFIETNIVLKRSSLGSPLINLLGEVVGVATGLDLEGRAMYTPIDLVRGNLATLLKSKTGSSTPEKKP